MRVVQFVINLPPQLLGESAHLDLAGVLGLVARSNDVVDACVQGRTFYELSVYAPKIFARFIIPGSGGGSFDDAVKLFRKYPLETLVNTLELPGIQM